MGKALSPIYLHKVDFAQLLVYNQSLTTESESRLFGSVVRALILYQGDPGSIPSKGMGNFFSYALLFYGYHVVRWDWTLFFLKRLSVIIKDDFFEEGEFYGQGTLSYIST